MKKQVLNIGKAIHATQQKQIFGGANKGIAPPCENPSGNACDPSEGGMAGNNNCNLNEVCSPAGYCVCLN